MTKNTAMSEAFKKAGRDVDADALYALAARLLKGHRNPAISLDSFVEKVTAGAPLLVALMPRESIRNEALRYLRTVAADMTGQPGKAKLDVTPSPRMPSPAGGERGGHVSGDAQWLLASPSSPSKQNGGGQSRRDVHAKIAPAGSRDGSGHIPRDAHAASAAPSREPTSVQKAAAAAVAREVAKSISGEYRVLALGNRLLHAVRPADYEEMIQKGGRDHILGRELKAWRDRKVAFLPADAVTSDIIPREMLDRMVTVADEIVTCGMQFTNDDALLAYLERQEITHAG